MRAVVGGVGNAVIVVVIVAGISCAVAVGVGLVGVVDSVTVVAGAGEAVAVAVGIPVPLVLVFDGRAVVAGVSNAVGRVAVVDLADIFLPRVVHIGAIVLRAGQPVAVEVDVRVGVSRRIDPGREIIVSDGPDADLVRATQDVAGHVRTVRAGDRGGIVAFAALAKRRLDQRDGVDDTGKRRDIE